MSGDEMSQYDEKSVLGFNAHSFTGYFLSVVFIAVVPLFMLLMPTAPALSFLVVLVATVLWVYLTKSFLFWTLQSGFYVCFMALGMSGNGAASKNQKAFEGKTPISAQSLASTPVTGEFLLVDASLDNQIKGSHRACEEAGPQYDPVMQSLTKGANEETRCTEASVTALTTSASATGDSDESVIVAWVVRDRRGWPLFFGDTDDPMPLTTSSGGVFSPGSAVPEKAREQACKHLTQKESLWGQEFNVQSCPIDAPLFWTVDIVPFEMSVKKTLPLSKIIIGFHSVVAWIIVLITVLRRAFK
jgi:hypothetical protein